MTYTRDEEQFRQVRWEAFPVEVSHYYIRAAAGLLEFWHNVAGLQVSVMLDAVRAFALLCGIVLHATLSFFLPIPAHDVSQSVTLSVVFFLIHAWRMTTFFIVAGLFARLVITRRGTRGSSSAVTAASSSCRRPGTRAAAGTPGRPAGDVVLR